MTPWTAAHQPSLSITNSLSLLKLMPIELVMPSNHLTLCHPLLLCLQSFLASGSFPMSQFFASSGHSIGVSASASVLPVNIQATFVQSTPKLGTAQLSISPSIDKQINKLKLVSLVTQSCPALCDPMDCRMPGFPVHHELPELTHTHAHRVGDAIQPSHPLSSPSPPTFNLSQH